MLPACAHSPATNRPTPPDPIVETRTVRVKQCPSEVTAAIPPAEPTPAGAVIDASREVLRWIGRRFAREELLARRLTDAKAACNG